MWWGDYWDEHLLSATESDGKSKQEAVNVVLGLRLEAAHGLLVDPAGLDAAAAEGANPRLGVWNCPRGSSYFHSHTDQFLLSYPLPQLPFPATLLLSPVSGLTLSAFRTLKTGSCLSAAIQLSHDILPSLIHWLGGEAASLIKTSNRTFSRSSTLQTSCSDVFQDFVQRH